jgi:hypothetical protein
MGCSGSRDSAKASDEEKLLINRENSLGFNKYHATHVRGIIQRYSYEGKINMNQMEETIASLQLTVPEWKQTGMPLSDFFEQFKIGENEFDYNLFVLTGILLSNSLNRDKAQLFFEHADP